MKRFALLLLAGLFVASAAVPAEAGIFRRRRNCSSSCYSSSGWRNRVRCSSGACSTVSAKSVVQKSSVQKSSVAQKG